MRLANRDQGDILGGAAGAARRGCDARAHGGEIGGDGGGSAGRERLGHGCEAGRLGACGQGAAAGSDRLPVLWLFTDAARQPDPLASVRRLPRGLAGVVLRDDGLAGRAELGRSIAAVCRARRLALAVAGDWRLAAALHAGLHLRAGRRPPCARRQLLALTSSVHGAADLIRASRAGAAAGVPLARLPHREPLRRARARAAALGAGGAPQRRRGGAGRRGRRHHTEAAAAPLPGRGRDFRPAMIVGTAVQSDIVVTVFREGHSHGRATVAG